MQGLSIVIALSLGIIAPRVDAGLFHASHAMTPPGVHHAIPPFSELSHSTSSPISHRHSRAAILVMCVRGVSAVLDAALIMRPLIPWDERKHASAAPAGPVPTIKTSPTVTTGLSAPWSPGRTSSPILTWFSRQYSEDFA